ncbi:MAG: hypothetical protein ACXVED_11320 [Bacteroidia bacterium]
MKKLLLSITAVIALSAGAKAQGAPDMGFETWQNISFTTVQDPVGWDILNALSAISSTPLSV